MRAVTKEINRIEAEQKAKEAERLAKEKADKEWWESKQDWIDRFPFEPTYHSEITYDRNARGVGHEEMRKMAKNHSFLRMFHNSRLPYTEEFEQLYDIVKEVAGEEKADNPIVLGWTFNTLLKHHKAKAQDPEAIYQKNAQVYRPPPYPRTPPNLLEGLTPEQLAAYRVLPEREKRTMTAELRASQSAKYREQLRAYHAAPKYQTVDITWGEQAEQEKEYILGSLLRRVQPDQSWLSRDQAARIQERLLNEIPAEGFLEMGKENLCYVSSYKRELKAGDPLLIK